MRAWRMYESKNPDRQCRCPVCNSDVDRIGEPLPMRRIAELIAGVREECQLLKGLAEWNQDTPQEPRRDNQQECNTLLINFGQPDNEVTTVPKPAGDQWNEIVRAPQPRPKPAPLHVKDASALTIDAKPTTLSSPVPSVILSPWSPISPEDFNSTDVWETEAKERDFFRLSDPALDAKSPPNLSRRDTIGSDNFSTTTSETTSDDHTLEVGALSPTKPLRLQFPQKPFTSTTQPPTSPRPEEPKTPIRHVSPGPDGSSPPTRLPGSQRSINFAEEPLDTPVWEPSRLQSEKPSPSPAFSRPPEYPAEESYGAALADSAPRTSLNTSIEAAQPSSISSLKHSLSSNTVRTELLPVEGRRSPVSQRESKSVSLGSGSHLDTRSRASSIISDTATNVSSPNGEQSQFWRKASFSSNLRRFSASSAPKGTHHNGDSDTRLSDKDGFPDPGPTAPMRSFYVKAVAREQVGVAKKYQASAISETCLTVALITSQDFSIYTVGEKATSRLICCGTNDGKYGKSFDDTKKDLDAIAQPREFRPTYVRATMSDRVLCIACAESCVDIYLTTTGRRIGTIQFPRRKCTSLKMCPNGDNLAAGMETGEVLLYTAGSSENFLTAPAMLTDGGSKSVNAITFSPNSRFLAFCSANLVYTYRLGADGPRLLSKYNRHLTEKQCRSPYFGVTSIALYLHHTYFLTTAPPPAHLCWWYVTRKERTLSSSITSSLPKNITSPSC